MYLLTFYKLWAGKSLHSKENVAKYFESDLRYLEGFTEDMGFEALAWDTVSADIEEAIMSNQKPENLDQKKILTSFFIGDGEWNEPLAAWGIHPANLMVDLIEYNWFHRFRELSREYGDPSLVRVPQYSTPDNVKGREKAYEYPFRHYSLTDLSDCIILATSILSLEWTEYVMDEIGLDYNQDLVHRTRNETLEHFSEGSEISEDSQKILRSLKRNDNIWLESVKQDFSMNSLLLSYVEKSNKKFYNELSEK